MAGTSALKVAEQIKVITTAVLARLHDPRLGFVTVTEVRLSRDWQVGEVFYTVLGDDQELAATAAGLEAAKGQVRSAVAKALRLRTTPAIEFVADRLPQDGGDFEELLASVKAADAQIAARARGAAFAGEEDPYKPQDDSDPR
jgi:ribosome-binding factor A